MPNEQDESLGVEQLPQTELDTAPGSGEERPSNTEDDQKVSGATTDAAKTGSEQDRKDEIK